LQQISTKDNDIVKFAHVLI